MTSDENYTKKEETDPTTGMPVFTKEESENASATKMIALLMTIP